MICSGVAGGAEDRRLIPLDLELFQHYAWLACE